MIITIYYHYMVNILIVIYVTHMIPAPDYSPLRWPLKGQCIERVCVASGKRMSDLGSQVFCWQQE
jgi:hypothetical protein